MVFFALAPDLYRQEPTTRPDRAQRRMMAHSINRAETDMRSAAAYLLSLEGVVGEHVGALGCCLGGGLTIGAAATSPIISATVTDCNVTPQGKADFAPVSGPVLGRFGTEDEFAPLADARSREQELRIAGVEPTFEFYRAGHAVLNDTNRLGPYNADMGVRSWVCAITFLRDRVGAWRWSSRMCAPRARFVRLLESPGRARVDCARPDQLAGQARGTGTSGRRARG